MRPWFANCIAAARAYGIAILDSVYNDIGDAEGFARGCAEARDMGFDGKTIVHPNQIALQCSVLAQCGRDRGRAKNHRGV
jgi:citrate lyase subunit beta/citryl-CoA lyase